MNLLLKVAIIILFWPFVILMKLNLIDVRRDSVDEMLGGYRN